jgi:hypothetical protein
VRIKAIPYEEYFIWRVNLEHEVQGLSRIENRTVEIALALIKKRKKDFLNVYLIELKSRIDDKYLADILKTIVLADFIFCYHSTTATIINNFQTYKFDL